MFDTIRGLPAHALIVHAAVVLVPLLVAVAIGYALVPRARNRLDWAAALLAVIAPAAAYAATQSGARLEARLVAKGYSTKILAQVSQHERYGNRTMYWALALGVVTLLLVLLTNSVRRFGRAPAWLTVLLAAIVVVLGLVTVYYVFRTGESGATAVWKGI